MLMPLIFLAGQTILFWILVVALYRLKSKYTLIPLYSYVAVLTVLTHNLSDLGFAVIYHNWFFLIASVSFFTTLMFATLFLYLLEGPRAGRIALWTILGASLFYIFVVFSLGWQVDTKNWVTLNFATAKTYFFSLGAIIIDIIFLGFFWELLSKIKKMNLVLRVFLVIFTVLAIDTLIFTTGVFGAEDIYFSILKGNLAVRLLLAIIGAPIITALLKTEGFTEENREKPKKLWEILNFRSDLEIKIFDLEKAIKDNKKLTDELKSAKETYELVISGSGAGIWDWDLKTNSLKFSPRIYEMLGFKPAEMKEVLDTFKNLIHPDDYDKTFKIINQCIKNGKPYETEYRLKTKSGKYIWVLANGITKYDEKKNALRMVGSIININAKKEAEINLKQKMDETASMNKALVGRELKIIELKKEIEDLKDKKTPQK